MASTILFRIVLACAFISAAAIIPGQVQAGAATWQATGQRDNKGVRNAYITLQHGAHSLSFSCREGGKPSLHMLLTGKSFPNLYAADDVEAVLNFRIDLPGGVTHKNSMKAWYFGPDQAWTGQFPVNGNILNSFAHAESMSLLNPKGQLVLRFSMKGSATAVKTIRQNCRLGLR